VHDVLTAINKSLFPKTHENLAHGTVQVFVHGEVLARPVNRIAEPLHLLENIAAVEATPLPHAFDELLTSKVGAFCPFACELSLNQHLRRNAGVVCTGIQSVISPRIRRQRTRMSDSVCSNMCPMCRLPVTFGGGSRIVNAAGASLDGVST